MSDMQALTTVYTPQALCADRFAVFIAGTPSTSTIPPSSGWVDPSFTECIPTEYQTPYPTFSPGVCPDHMSLVAHTSNMTDRRTVWTGICCQRGFSTHSLTPGWICTSSVATPMAFLLDPNITTADIYTTLSSLWIEHDQITVQWEKEDLSILPTKVVTLYESIMETPHHGMHALPSKEPTRAPSPMAETTLPAELPSNVPQAAPIVKALPALPARTISMNATEQSEWTASQFISSTSRASPGAALVAIGMLWFLLPLFVSLVAQKGFV